MCSLQGVPAGATTTPSCGDVVLRPHWWNLESTIPSSLSWSVVCLYKPQPVFRSLSRNRNCTIFAPYSGCLTKHNLSLRSGDGHKNPPWASQRQHLLNFLLLVFRSDGPSQFHAGWNGPPLHVRRSFGCRASDHVSQCLYRGAFTPHSLCLTNRRKCWTVMFLCFSGPREEEEGEGGRGCGARF